MENTYLCTETENKNITTMKSKQLTHIFPMAVLFAFCLSATVVTSCSDSDDNNAGPVVPPEPGDEENTEGQVESVTISLDEGTATIENPAVVSASTPTTVSMAVTTNYTEPDGTTFQASPKASVTLSIDADTVKCKTIGELLAISRTVDKDSRQTEGETVTTKAERHYAIGGQTVRFDVAYERIDHKNTAGKVVTLPYMLLSSPIPGELEETMKETRAAFRPRVAAIRMRPSYKAATRGSITQEEVYDISVTFTAEATPVNAGTELGKRTIAFDVEYVAIVGTPPNTPTRRPPSPTRPRPSAERRTRSRPSASPTGPPT